jgi:hypothetical protein
MLRCLGIPVTKPTNLYGDNLGVIQSATIPEGELKKKHVAVAYHYVRESIAAGFINAIWVKSYVNFADVCTKALGAVVFNEIVRNIIAWTQFCIRVFFSFGLSICFDNELSGSMCR